MFTPTGFLYVPLPCTHNFEQYRQMARLCIMKISSKCNLEHLLVQAIQTQNPEIFAGKFYESFLKRCFPILPSSDKHLTAGSRDVRINDKSWNLRTFVFVFQSCFKAKMAHEQFGNTAWVDYELALLARSGRHFLVQQQRAAFYTSQKMICAMIGN